MCFWRGIFWRQSGERFGEVKNQDQGYLPEDLDKIRKDKKAGNEGWL